METDDFAVLVLNMRRYQRRYFATKARALLPSCRDLERRVDAALTAKLRPIQGDLFTIGPEEKPDPPQGV